MIQQKTTTTIFLILIATAMLLAIYYILETGKPRITGFHEVQVGTGIVTFMAVCGDGEIGPGEECDPPGSVGQCPGGKTCQSDCKCPRQPGQGGGAGGYQAECCRNVWLYDREYWCDCVIEERGLIRIQPYTCCRNPLALECFDFCKLAQYPEQQAPVAGVCPTERTCGPLCCKTGEACRNGECIKPEIEQYIPPPPPIEGPTLVAIPYTTYAFPWWYFILAAIILLVLSYLLYRKSHVPKPETPPSEVMQQKPRKKRKKT